MNAARPGRREDRPRAPGSVGFFRRNAPRLALGTLFAGALVVFFLLGGHEHLSFEALKQGRDRLIDYTARHFALALAASLGAFIAATAFSLPVATVLSLAVGLMFGRWLGTGIIVAGGTLGATLLLIVARYVLRDWLERRAAGHLGRFDAVFRRNAFLYVAFIRVVPVFPFWLVNLAAAGTRIRASTYAAATAVGMIPISFIWASLGQSLAHVESPRDALSGTTLIALSLLGLAGLASIFAKDRVFKESTDTKDDG